ncbi:VTT domain-containing protein [Acrocarpospora sp. B8E8]|uniref:DedA family protein n=1 Tax=Acrocarpospora sp. B8E8 TaxID=3153572 RepID=UPI00325EE888
MDRFQEFVAALLQALDRESPVMVGLALLFLLAMEGTLIVGLLVPGDAAILIAGMALAGPAEIAEVAVAGVLGCYLGASMGYLIGLRFGPWLRAGRVGAWVGPERWRRAELAMSDLADGGPAFAFAYFVPVMHALTPILAGALGVPYRGFMRRAMLGGTAWVVGYLILGSVTGEVLRRQLDLVVPLVAVLALAASVIPLARRLHRRRRGRVGRGHHRPPGIGAQIPEAIGTPTPADEQAPSASPPAAAVGRKDRTSASSR